MEYTSHSWICPKCKQYHRVRGIGTKIRRCKCGFKVMITSAYEKVSYYRPIIVSIEE